MSKVSDAFKNEKAFIAFVTGGDPDLEITQKLIIEMEKNGADIIEVGIPFSDPIAEGPVIQEADLRALQGGCTTDKLFDAIKEIKRAGKYTFSIYDICKRNLSLWNRKSLWQDVLNVEFQVLLYLIVHTKNAMN